MPFFLGAGAYRHHVPATVDHLIQRSEFLTSYTPYQPEIAQGTLQVLFEFQTQVAALTGMEVANASMYDGSTACGEAMLMAHRLTRRAQGGAVGRPASAICRRRRDARRRWRATRSCACRSIRAPPRTSRPQIDDETTCVVVQTPDFFGNLRDLEPIAAAAHAKGALLVAVFTEAVSLGAVRSPGEMGADIVVGEGQSIGNALNFGGPYVGLFATRLKIRAADAGAARRRDGRRRRAARLRADAVDARAAHPPREGDEQHLHQFRPVRARLLDPSDAARRSGPAPARRASITPTRSISPSGSARSPASACSTTRFFNEFTIRTPRAGGGAGRRRWRRAESSAACRCRGSRRDAGLDDLIVVAATEVSTPADRQAYAEALAQCLQAGATEMNNQGRPTRPNAGDAPRRGTFTGNRALDMEEALIFETGRLDATGVDFDAPAPFASKLGAHARDGAIGLPGLTEPEAVRHYVRLSRNNYAIDAGLYPLGSCTMKHNPRLNEKMARLPGFADIHPLQPIVDRAGRAGADRLAGACAADADRHERGGDVAEGRRARRTVRHDGDQGGARRARRGQDAHRRPGARLRPRHQSRHRGADRLFGARRAGGAPTASSAPKRCARRWRPTSPRSC